MDEIRNFFMKDGKIRKMRVFLATILGLVIIGAVVGDDDSSTNVSSNGSNEVKQQYALPRDYRAIEEAYINKTFQTVSVIKIKNDYKANEVAGDKKYKDKVVKLTGRVEEVGKVWSNLSVSYKTGQFSLISVKCTIDEEYKNIVSGLRPGNKFISYGVVKGFAGSGSAGRITLDPCLPASTIKKAMEKFKDATTETEKKQ